MKHEINQHFMRLAQRCDLKRRISSPDGYAAHTGECGDTVELFLMSRERNINAVYYDTNGCLNTNACANALADLVVGETLDRAWQINPEDIITYLQGLPTQNHHCAELVIGALHRALVDLQANAAKTWQKLYRPHRRPDPKP